MNQGQPMFLDGPGGVRLYARYHEPAGRPRGAFVFVHPLFEEKKSAHRILLETAAAFAGVGLAVLRLDLRGCGDSSGRLEDASVAGWLDDIGLGLAEVGRRAPSVACGLLGLRLGATLAGAAAERCSSVGRLVLWEPVVDPRAAIAQDLRRRLVREMMTHGKARRGRGDAIAQATAEHPLDFEGYPLTPAMLEGLGGLDWGRKPLGFGGSVLLVSVSGSGSPSPTVASLAASLASARVQTATVQALPFWNLVGLASCPEIVRASVEWAVANA